MRNTLFSMMLPVFLATPAFADITVDTFSVSQSTASPGDTVVMHLGLTCDDSVRSILLLMTSTASNGQQNTDTTDVPIMGTPLSGIWDLRFPVLGCTSPGTHQIRFTVDDGHLDVIGSSMLDQLGFPSSITAIGTEGDTEKAEIVDASRTPATIIGPNAPVHVTIDVEDDVNGVSFAKAIYRRSTGNGSGWDYSTAGDIMEKTAENGTSSTWEADVSFTDNSSYPLPGGTYFLEIDLFEGEGFWSCDSPPPCLWRCYVHVGYSGVEWDDAFGSLAVQYISPQGGQLETGSVHESSWGPIKQLFR